MFVFFIFIFFFALCICDKTQDWVIITQNCVRPYGLAKPIICFPHSQIPLGQVGSRIILVPYVPSIRQPLILSTLLSSTATPTTTTIDTTKEGTNAAVTHPSFFHSTSTRPTRDQTATYTSSLFLPASKTAVTHKSFSPPITSTVSTSTASNGNYACFDARMCIYL
jgi:hypothetical protein